ncbi:protein TOO MANY MOUTHS-like [Iris pallida]|uniref:Protein TOO MANY MOUTHS-like n=1 Tax=Iris pallida TaxID=29817 RepID=A0AAX6GRT0_IRIPA|nr:protein TOO MANY MOUTHS-like [Iris pallida]
MLVSVCRPHFLPTTQMPLFTFVLLLLSSLPPLTSPHAHGNTNNSMDPHEKETLFQVMDSMSSDRDWRSSSPDPCSPGSSWPGLECKQAGGLLHVTRLDFGTPHSPTCKPTATFPPQVFLLPHLQSLFFSDCFKTTPSSIPAPPSGPPPHLEQLSLRSNPALVGPIPPQLFSLASLKVLTLSQNRLSGKIPAEGLSLLTSLVHLDLSYNSLTGRIPAQIGLLESLADLDLSYNSLSGPIPASVGRMGSLQKLDLSSNSLSGGVPDSLGNLSLLAFLALSSNRLAGELPSGLPRLQSLQYFLMDDNPMAVRLPFQLGRLARLRELRLANSGYWGPIPGSFAWLANLTTLSLEDNRLTGEIPRGLGGLGRIYHLNLSRNMLGGVVPFDAGFVRRLGGNLDLSGNPGLCARGDVGVEVGVDVCGGGGGGSSEHQLMGRSGGAVRRFVCWDFSTLLLGIFGGLTVHHWLLL